MVVPLLLVVALVGFAACGGDDTPLASNGRDDSTTAGTQAGSRSGGRCGPPSPTRDANGPSVAMREIGSDGDVRVEAAVYPRRKYGGNPWTHWGQGIVLPDGRYLSAIGDHLGPDGNAYLFVYDPKSGELTELTDVLSLVDHDKGDWGYGKVHAQMVAGPCDEIYVATYWGTLRDLEFGGTYSGDFLMRLDPDSLEIDVLGVPVPRRGIPSMASDPDAGLLFGEAFNPREEQQPGPEGAFFAYDVEREEVVFQTEDGRHTGFRSIGVGADGTVYLAGPGKKLLTWAPGDDELTVHGEELPGTKLRAVTRPAPDGTVYAVTEDPPVFFALRPNGRIETLSTAKEYTTSLALSPDGSRFYSVPGAHGDAWRFDTPLIAVDTETGKQSVVAELNPMIEKELGLTANGTYNVVADPDGDTVYVALNAGEDRDDPWGEIVLAVVHLE